MELSPKPNEQLADKALPPQLRQAIQATFAGGLRDCALVGGTALAGYYACHRISNDMDLFTGSEIAQSQTVVSIKNLQNIGAIILQEQAIPTYYHADIEFSGYTFTADVVLDKRLHQIGTFHRTPSGILVADLETLFKMKIAALVSRCSEKDLYDLLWITEHTNEHINDSSITEWLRLGQEIDSGLTAETALIALTMADLKVSACSFASRFGVSNTEVHARITEFRATLQQRLADYLARKPADPKLQTLIRTLKRHKN